MRKPNRNAQCIFVLQATPRPTGTLRSASYSDLRINFQRPSPAFQQKMHRIAIIAYTAQLCKRKILSHGNFFSFVYIFYVFFLPILRMFCLFFYDSVPTKAKFLRFSVGFRIPKAILSNIFHLLYVFRAEDSISRFLKKYTVQKVPLYGNTEKTLWMPLDKFPML